MKLQKTFRFDDVSLNTDSVKLNKMVSSLLERYPNSNILFGVSALVHDMSNLEGKKKERIFPEILNAYSDFRVFYNVDKAGVPIETISLIAASCPTLKIAGHGLVHVDHRLLSKEVQEISILISCNLINSKIFIPPFNKYNHFTEEICKEHNIDMIKFEDGWKHLLYNKISDNASKYYLHTHDLTYEEFLERI